MLTLSQSGKMVKVERPTQAFRDGYEDGKNGVDNSWLYAGGHAEREYKHGWTGGAGNFGKRIAALAGGSEQPYTPWGQPDSEYADVVPAEDRPEHVGV